MSNFLVTRRAEIDLDDAWDTIAARSVRAADRLVAAIRKKCAFYARFPGLGILRDDFAPNLRCFVVKRYVLFYRELAGAIEILRVLHGSRDRQDHEGFGRELTEGGILFESKVLPRKRRKWYRRVGVAHISSIVVRCPLSCSRES
jgi:toxin ParE1/3/4